MQSGRPLDRGFLREWLLHECGSAVPGPRPPCSSCQLHPHFSYFAACAIIPASSMTMAKETSSKLQSFPTQETMNLELVKASPAPLPEAVTKLKTALKLKDQEIEILHRI